MKGTALSRNDTRGDTKSNTLIAVYQLQLELVSVNPADIHWQARIHMRRVKRHRQTRAGKRQGIGDVLAPLLEQQLPALPGLPSSLMSGRRTAIKGATRTPAPAVALSLQPSWRSWEGRRWTEGNRVFLFSHLLALCSGGVTVPWLPMKKSLLSLPWVSGSALGKKWYLGDTVK